MIQILVIIATLDLGRYDMRMRMRRWMKGKWGDKQKVEDDEGEKSTETSADIKVNQQQTKSVVEKLVKDAGERKDAGEILEGYREKANSGGAKQQKEQPSPEKRHKKRKR